jgi:hypothetical protein
MNTIRNFGHREREVFEDTVPMTRYRIPAGPAVIQTRARWWQRLLNLFFKGDIA